MDDETELPVHFRYQGEIYRGNARFRANWHHIYVTGRLLRTGGWDFALAHREMGDDKYAISAEQLEELKAGHSVQVQFPWEDMPITIEPGDYSPAPDDRIQRNLFED